MLNNTFNSSMGPEIDKSVVYTKPFRMIETQRRSVDDGNNITIKDGKILNNFSAKHPAASFN